jgi:putative transposase
MKKVQLYPTQTQRETLNKWFGTARWTYNRCVTAVKEGEPRNKKCLRAKCVNNVNFETEFTWVKEVPYDIRDEAMNDLLKAYKCNFGAKRKKFDIRLKSKKSTSDSIVIHSKHWKKAGIFHPTYWGKVPIHTTEELPDKLDYDCRLQRTRLGDFYLCIPQPLLIRGENQTPQNVRGSTILAIDPGVRTFITGYSPDGTIIEWGTNDMARIYRLCHSLDDLQSRWNSKSINHKKRYKMQTAGRRVREKIRDLIRDFHHKCAKYLCENYGYILLPTYQSQQMVRRGRRRIGSKTARAMLTWSPYRFKQRLLDKIREYPWCKVFIVDEHHTSKTCGNCGNLHDRLGGNKVFNCPSCRVVMDRDANAARNILLRFMTVDERALFVSDESGVGAYPHPNFVSDKKWMQDFITNVHFEHD